MFGFIYQGGLGLHHPLCAVLYITEGGQLSTVPCVWFYIEFSMAFGGGDGVRYLPMLGGSELNNLTCGVGKKNSGTLRKAEKN